jgi:hypothetical protein
MVHFLVLIACDVYRQPCTSGWIYRDAGIISTEEEVLFSNESSGAISWEWILVMEAKVWKKAPHTNMM